MITTYWGNTDFGEKRDLGPPWELQYREGVGYFAIALRDFEAGELICREKPTTYTAGWHPFTPEQTKRINADVGKLPEHEQKAFFEMANAFPECDPAAGIYMTNSFDMTSSSSSGACGMYLAIARLNHSCRPNAQQTHIPKTKEEVLYATRFIRRGEELCDCYIELRQSTAERRRELQEYYRFTCCCPACADHDADTVSDGDEKGEGEKTTLVETNTETILQQGSKPTEITETNNINCTIAAEFSVFTSMASVVLPTSTTTSTASANNVTAVVNFQKVREADDKNRIAAMKLDKKMMKLAEEGQVQKALKCALEVIEVLGAPASQGWGERYLADTHLCVFHFSCSLFREGYDQRKWRDMAEKASHQAYILNLRLQGPSSPDTIRSLEYVQKIDHFLNDD